MNHKASMTALMSAFGRTYHTEKAKNPVFRAEMAQRLMTEREYQMIGSYILSGIDFFVPEQKGLFETNDDALRFLVYTPIAPTPIARTRFCEERLKTAMLTATEQYVILGAGLDTFTFRESDFVKRYHVFEVDHR